LGTGITYVNTPQRIPIEDTETELAFWNLPPVWTANQITRFCCFRNTPLKRIHGGKYDKISENGYELCELNFSDQRFLGLMTVT